MKTTPFARRLTTVLAALWFATSQWRIAAIHDDRVPSLVDFLARHAAAPASTH